MSVAEITPRCAYRPPQLGYPRVLRARDARRGELTVTHGRGDRGRLTPDGSMSAEAELELDAAESDAQRTLLALAVTAAGIGTFDWDLVTGTLRWDERLLDMFGYDTNSFDETIEAFNVVFAVCT